MQVVLADDQAKVRQAAKAAGADAFVSKGDPPERLLTAMEKVYRE
jgi:DNA-binding NarL/FixJ family response regulator